MNIRKLLSIPAILAALTLCAGCNNKNYEFYTNIPDGGYELINSRYVQGDKIGGYSGENKQFDEVDTSAYTAKYMLIPALFAEAEIIVVADFTSEDAILHYNKFCNEVKAKLNSIDKSLSSTVKNSDMYKFNNAAAGEKIEINEITYEVLSQAKAVYELTDGYYNPALYYNVEAYGFGNSEAYPNYASQLPADEEIAKYTNLASHFNELALSKEEEKFFVTKPDYSVEVYGETLTMKLDLGGIGKGYAVDEVDKIFDEYGYKFGYMNFSASSMFLKSHTEFGAYSVVLTDPRSPSRDPYMIIPVRGERLSTSGDNEKFYILDGVRYCHIIDPTTGKPVQTGITSVTVIGGSASEDDALTTAIMAMGKERAAEFIEEKLNDRLVVFTCE